MYACMASEESMHTHRQESINVVCGAWCWRWRLLAFSARENNDALGLQVGQRRGSNPGQARLHPTALPRDVTEIGLVGQRLHACALHWFSEPVCLCSIATLAHCYKLFSSSTCARGALLFHPPLFYFSGWWMRRPLKIFLFQWAEAARCALIMNAEACLFVWIGGLSAHRELQIFVITRRSRASLNICQRWLARLLCSFRRKGFQLWA